MTYVPSYESLFNQDKEVLIVYAMSGTNLRPRYAQLILFCYEHGQPFLIWVFRMTKKLTEKMARQDRHCHENLWENRYIGTYNKTIFEEIQSIVFKWSYLFISAETDDYYYAIQHVGSSIDQPAPTFMLGYNNISMSWLHFTAAKTTE